VRKIVFVSFILFILASSIYAGEFYNCIDRDGNTILTNSPQDGMKKCVLKESYKDPTPQERAKEQREIEAYRQRMRAGIERNRAEAKQKSEALRAQASRDQRADKLKADASARLQAVRDAGFNLPQANIDMLEKAAEVKAEQIRQGTDTPMTAQEDADFHARQKEYEHESEIRDKQFEIDRLKRGY
jgi:Skp family chaperone for outer membrane proteins